MNIGTWFRVGSRAFSMAQDPNIHLLAKGAWGGVKHLHKLIRKTPEQKSEQKSPAQGSKRSPVESSTLDTSKSLSEPKSNKTQLKAPQKKANRPTARNTKGLKT